MATVSQLPASSKRLFKPQTIINLEGIATPNQRATAVETWQCDMADRTAFLNVVIGSLEVVGGYSGAVIRRVPLRHPEYPFLLATGARARSKGWDSATAFWKYVDIEVDFASPNYDLTGNGAFLSRAGDPATRPLPGSPAGFRLNGNPPPFDIDDGIEGEDAVFTTHNLPTLPVSVYDAARNKVNEGTFLDRPDGTWLYRGPKYNQTSNFDGSQTWDVTHTFSYSKVPWNQYYDTDGTLYDLYRADGTTLKFLKTDLSTVFNA